MRAQQKPYVESLLLVKWGLDMSASLKTSQTEPSILCVCQDSNLMNTRAALLRQIGAAVQCATGTEEAIRAIESANFDLLILCYSLLEGDKQSISRAAHLQAHAPLVLLLSTLSPLDSGREGVVFDEVSDTHPAVLTESVKELLQRRTGNTRLVTGEIATV
jgi:DNA-binding response OmpR family regulator